MEIPETKVFQFNVSIAANLDQTEDDVRERLKSVVLRGMLLGQGGKGYSKCFRAVRIDKQMWGIPL